MVAGIALATAHRGAGAARMTVYGHLADLLTYPTDDLVASLRDGSFEQSLGVAASELPYPLEIPDLPDADSLELSGEDGLGPEYIRLFDVPSGGNPCPLYGGALAGRHGSDRRQVMEDLLRFYRHFGLSVVHAEQRDLPDSIPTVVEFLAYLVFLEVEADSDEDSEPFRRAQHDVLSRHLASWSPVIRSRVAELAPAPLYAMATGLLDDVSRAELQALATLS